MLLALIYFRVALKNSLILTEILNKKYLENPGILREFFYKISVNILIIYWNTKKSLGSNYARLDF